MSPSKLKFAHKVFRHFKCKNIKEYHNLYLKVDTVLLHDVFNNFREKYYEEYGLDPVYYISASQFANAASLKCTGQTLELLSDREMYETYEAGIRGGISMITHRYALSNNCYFYDNKTEKLIKYLKNVR